MAQSTEPRSPDEPAARSDRRSRGVAWLAAGAAGIAVVTILALSGASALGVRGHLEAGRAALGRGRNTLTTGNAAGAEAEFARASTAFRAAAHEARSPWLTIAALIPVAGRTPDAVRAVADAGVQTAEAATELASAIANMPGGLGALAPTAAGIPTEQIPALADAVQRAATLTRSALETLDGTANGFVLPQVAEARSAARSQLDELHRQLQAGALILRGLPAFLGADGPRHYFVGASNPAELRGTGGLIGAYAILTIADGRLHLSNFRWVESLPRLDVSQVPSPSTQYSSNFDYFRNGVGFWLNINISPDFPLDAEAISLAYRAATGRTLDGVIVADPFALKALMRVTGPVDIARTGLSITAGDVVPFVTNRAYALFQTNAQRRLVLGKVFGPVLASFLSRREEPLARLEASLDAFKDGHVKVWSADATMERGLAATTAGGAFDPTGTDTISVITNSFSGTKLDYYQDRTISYDVQLGPEEMATASLVVELGNPSPTSGYPPYVIGPYKRFSRRPGENVALVHLYCDTGCSLRGATEGGKTVQLRRLRQANHPFFEDYVRTPSGGTARIAANLYLPQAWTGDGNGGTYHLSFIGQTTIRPTTLRVVIHPPGGMAFTSSSPELTRRGNALVYEGQPSGNLDLEATFAPPLPMRVWRDITGWMG